ncbi:hypothetical protein NP493_639g02005 [Ridgeia piscesae]|uniref:Uncharacterized protein n=1 Tax=Ridgeia piscesae TaxID=27915 RepID=A0AAD9KT37_RIDPI|nr:hypothetical protein NP493_639g02005 [Ridgeia piscesae]
MTIGFAGDKENVAPETQSQSMFRVSKVSTESNVWQPQQVPHQPVAPQPQPQPTSQMDYHAAMQPLTCDTGDINGELTAHVLRRILYDGSGSDECHTPDSPFGRKKKIFADSSFYDDPEHKYPTIEEQIKMARKVALSLMSPANVTARGHKMFIKRRQKSQKWTTDEFGHLQDTAPEYFTFEAESEEEEKYYNPNPWRPVHTWQPPSHMSPQVVHQHPHARPTSLVKPAPPPQQPSFVPAPPPPPPVPSGTGTWKPSPADFVDLNKRIMTQEESEKMRMYSQKTSHTAVSPQACFSLARDLHNMKGKGGKLFAKRRARVDKWVVDESSVPQAVPTPELIKKLTGGMVPPPADVPPPKSGPRLQQMIQMPKPAMTPWEAAQSGDVDKAFDHIDSYERQVALANMGVPPAAVMSAPGFSPAPSSSASSNNARLPDGARKIQGWGGTPSSCSQQLNAVDRQCTFRCQSSACHGDSSWFPSRELHCRPRCRGLQPFPVGRL